MQTLHIVYLDRAHLGDELFLKSLAQHFAEGASGEPPCLLVHGSGEKVERTLESKGYFPERTDGVLEIEGEDQRRLVERAVRETNQEIVAALTDEVVSTVGIQGVDRNLLTWDAEGQVTATKVGWLAALIKQRVVPVVSALVEDDAGTVEEVWAADVAVALANALSASFDPIVSVLAATEKPGVPSATGILDEIGVETLSDDDVADPAAVRRLHAADIPVLITNAQGLLGAEEPRGTRLTA
jgi:acetylglutamate kinase